ncbi:MAG: NitT/TauT family transport system permease protein [Solirubrobacteraceae bacterium]|jgi:NitT/TauT family transport system permease protein|nr:NitT/TauT family transport system permease protein [Solirubrobacteraceae bacterium]
MSASPLPLTPAATADEVIVRPSVMRARSRSMASVVLPPLVVFVAFVGLWFLASYVLISPSKRFLLPPPQDVVSVGFLDAHNSAEIFAGLWLTTKAALFGFLLSIVVGMALAIAMSQASWVERSIFPYAVVLQTLPILALVPLVGFTIGYDFPSRVLVVVLIALFPVITNTLFGLVSVDQSHHDLFSLHKVGRWTRLRKLQLPAALPAIFTGFRIAAGSSVIGAVVGDFFFKQGSPGIGVLIDLYSSQLESERLYAAVIAASLLGITVFVVVGVANRLVVGRWHTSTRAGG